MLFVERLAVRSLLLIVSFFGWVSFFVLTVRKIMVADFFLAVIFSVLMLICFKACQLLVRAIKSMFVVITPDPKIELIKIKTVLNFYGLRVDNLDITEKCLECEMINGGRCPRIFNQLCVKDICFEIEEEKTPPKFEKPANCKGCHQNDASCKYPITGICILQDKNPPEKK